MGIEPTQPNWSRDFQDVLSPWTMSSPCCLFRRLVYSLYTFMDNIQFSSALFTFFMGCNLHRISQHSHRCFRLLIYSKSKPGAQFPFVLFKYVFVLSKSLASTNSATPALCQRTFCFLWPDLDSNQDLPTCDWASLPLDDQTILLKMLIANHILSTTIHKYELIYL